MSDSKHCKYCEEAFDEEEGISESVTTPGVCEYCEQRLKALGTLETCQFRRVDMNAFSVCGMEHSFMDVTEWSNHEGIDVFVHEGKGLPDKQISLSYDELEAIQNVVNSFGHYDPVILLEKPNPNK
jgi:hypothetical protein